MMQNKNTTMRQHEYSFFRDLNKKLPYQNFDEKHETVCNSNCDSNTDLKIKWRTPNICVKYSRYPIISSVVRSLGWNIVNENDLWDIFWSDTVQNTNIFKEMKSFQRINHFPNMAEICRKGLLARNLNRMQKLFPNEFDMFPKTWCFPAELAEAKAFAKENKTKTFILKPDQGTQGKGIWLTNNLKEIKSSENLICQVYINRPLLIDGYKFDIRLYILITSLDPLRIFVYNEGLVRFATAKYEEPRKNNVFNTYMHLTNYSVNKYSRTFCRDIENGSKRKLSTLNKKLSLEGYNVKKLWLQIDDMINKTILSALPVLKHNYSLHFKMHDIVQGCFALLGFDVLIDSTLKPYVLEVNGSPSFHTYEEIDREIKFSLLRDTLSIVYVQNICRNNIMMRNRRKIQQRLQVKSKIKNLNKTVENSEYCKNIELQIDWEENHLGNFRRIMPTQNMDNAYDKFLFLQYQPFYCPTKMGKFEKKYEELTNQIQNHKKVENIKRVLRSKKISQTSVDNYSKNLKMTNIREQTYHKDNEWMPGNIILDSKERARIFFLEQREALIRSSDLMSMICNIFNKQNI